MTPSLFSQYSPPCTHWMEDLVDTKVALKAVEKGVSLFRESNQNSAGHEAVAWSLRIHQNCWNSHIVFIKHISDKRNRV
jgi:hypothetical protein